MKAKIFAIVILSILMVSCAKKSSDSSTPAAESTVTPGAPTVAIPNNGTPYTPSQTGIGYAPGNTFIYGGTGDFVFDSLGAYQEYTQRPIPDMSWVTNIKINLNLTTFGTGTYGGTVTIRYALQGQLYEGYFTSGMSANTTPYNIWFTKSGQQVWHGFFEDYMGAIVVVVDGVDAVGAGSPSTTTVHGSVWFKNFDPTYKSHPQTYCWFVTSGPYDCRSWPTSSGVNTTAAVYPNNGYIRLGTFTGVPLLQGFNGWTP
jgi:hypothetical protein